MSRYSLPFPVGKARAADLNLSPADLARVKERAAAGCQVLGLRYDKDPAVGTRFETLTRELGDGVHRDSEGRIRLSVPTMTWSAYVHLAFDDVLGGLGRRQQARLRAVAQALRELDRGQHAQEQRGAAGEQRR